MLIAKNIGAHLPYVAHYQRIKELWSIEKRGIFASFHALVDIRG